MLQFESNDTAPAQIKVIGVGGAGCNRRAHSDAQPPARVRGERILSRILRGKTGSLMLKFTRICCGLTS